MLLTKISSLLAFFLALFSVCRSRPPVTKNPETFETESTVSELSDAQRKRIRDETRRLCKMLADSLNRNSIGEADDDDDGSRATPPL